MTIRLLEPSVSIGAVSLLASGLTVDIEHIFVMDSWFSVFKSILTEFLQSSFSLFDCLVCRQNVTCLKPFTRYEHYADEDVDIIKPDWHYCVLNHSAKN